MYGNVAEWVHDYYGEDYYGSSPDRNPRGPQQGEFRVVRGGGWSSNAESTRSTHRFFSASVDGDRLQGYSEPVAVSHALP